MFTKKSSAVIRKYALLLITFTCSLFIPYVLYSFAGSSSSSSLQSDASSLQNDDTISLQKNGKQYEYPSFVKYSYQWHTKKMPSSATSIKNITSSIQQRKEALREIDQKYCGQDRCKFILPITITEQESKAQTHFKHIAFLSGKVGRTVVLPNVYGSHLGACLSHPFDFYYDEAWLESNAGNFNYITMDDFQAWILARHNAGVVPTGQEIYIQGSDPSDLLKKSQNCFSKSFDFSARPSVDYYAQDTPHLRKGMNLSKIMVSLLSDEARQYEYVKQSTQQEEEEEIPPVDVINLFYDRRYKFIQDPDAQAAIPYSERWTVMADEIAESLKPFIAIHWRMERLEPASNLLPCAKNLVDQIHQLNYQSVSKAPNVFLLTDYPHLLNTTDARPESMSFSREEVTQDHHEAMFYLQQHLNVTLTTINDEHMHPEELPKENWHLIPVDVQESIVDHSVLGLIDKLVAMKAQWFFAGKRGVCAKPSSFTSRISGSRTKAFKAGDKDIIDPLMTFGIEDAVEAM